MNLDEHILKIRCAAHYFMESKGTCAELAQEPNIRENRFGRTFSVAKAYLFVVISIAILVQSDE